jgi:hypothetical protein
MFKQHVNTPRYAKDAATKLYVDELGVKLQVAIDDAIDTIPPPLDAYTKTEADTRYVNVTGDTMTGMLDINYTPQAVLVLRGALGNGGAIGFHAGGQPRFTVVGEDGGFSVLRFNDAGAPQDFILSFARSSGLGTVVGNPTAPLGIATKQYTDQLRTDTVNGLNSKVAKAGDTMSGPLIVSPKGSVFGIPTGSASTPTKAEANILLYDFGSDNWCGFGADGSGHLWARTGNSGSPGPAFILSASDQRMTLAGNPTQPMHAATKGYVDTAVGAISTANFVLKAGDTMTGPLNLVGGGTWSYNGPGAGSYYSTNTVANRFYVGTATGADAFRIYTSAFGNALYIEGSTGNVSIAKELGVSGNCTVWGPALTLNGPSGQSASFNMTKAVAGDVVQSYINSAGFAKWLIRWCDAGEGHMNFYRYNADASAIVGTPISLNWTNGDINLNSGTGTLLLLGGSVYVGPTATFASGALWVHNNTANGTIYLGNTATCYLQSSGGVMYLNGPPLTIYPQTTISGMLLANGKISINSSTGLIANSAGSHALEVKSAGVGNSAFMAFHIPGSFAANFGIDTDTFWKVGGWSMGGVAHKVWHDGICPNSGTYFKMPSGLMYVMGTCPAGMGNGWVNFPVAFPTTVLGIAITGQGALGDGNSITCNQQAFELGRFYFQPRYVNSGGAVGVATQLYFYVAWGY